MLRYNGCCIERLRIAGAGCHFALADIVWPVKLAHPLRRLLGKGMARWSSGWLLRNLLA